MTPFTKLEVRGWHIAQSSKEAKPQLQLKCTENITKFGHVVFEISRYCVTWPSLANTRQTLLKLDIGQHLWTLLTHLQQVFLQ